MNGWVDGVLANIKTNKFYLSRHKQLIKEGWLLTASYNCFYLLGKKKQIPEKDIQSLKDSCALSYNENV